MQITKFNSISHAFHRPMLKGVRDTQLWATLAEIAFFKLPPLKYPEDGSGNEELERAREVYHNINILNTQKLPDFDEDLCFKSKQWITFGKNCKLLGPIRPGLFTYDMRRDYRDWKDQKLLDNQELADRYVRLLPRMDMEKFYSLLFSFRDDGHLMLTPRDTALYLAGMRNFGVTVSDVNAAEREMRREGKSVVSKPVSASGVEYTEWVQACQERKVRIARAERELRDRIEELKDDMKKELAEVEDKWKEQIKEVRKQIGSLELDDPVPVRP